MSRADLRKTAEIAPNIMTKMCRDEPDHLHIIERIYKEPDCNFGDIADYFKKESDDEKI